MKFSSALIAIFLFLAIAQAVPTNIKGSLSVDDLIRMRCSHNPEEETYFFFNGSVTAYVGADSGPSFSPFTSIKPLFSAVGINVARCYKSQTGVWYLVGREAMWYINTATDEILSSWTNLDQVPVNVVHVDNDPVMQTFNPAQTPSFPAQIYGDDTILPSDVTSPLNYANVLQTPANETFNAYAPQKFYQAAELFKFISPTADVFSDKDAVDSTMVAWTRTSQFLPWMKMGQKPGYLLYSFQGSKIADYTHLPAKIKADIDARLPHYKHAPQAKCFPDMAGSGHSLTGGVTSWSFFKENFAGYLAGQAFPLSTARQYGCRTEPQYVPAPDTQCKATATITKSGQWQSGSNTVTQYNVVINNVGVKAVNGVAIEIQFANVVGKWNLNQVASSSVYNVDLWGNTILAGKDKSGYGIQVIGNPAVSVASVTCV